MFLVLVSHNLFFLPISLCFAFLVYHLVPLLILLAVFFLQSPALFKQFKSRLHDMLSAEHVKHLDIIPGARALLLKAAEGKIDVSVLCWVFFVLLLLCIVSHSVILCVVGAFLLV